MHEYKNRMSSEKCKDAGLALILIGLICYQFWRLPLIMGLTIIALLITMICPVILRPFARLWFGLSELLGTVVSKILLSVLFITLVLPIGLIRRGLGKDAMQLKRWKQDKNSVFRTRDHEFTAEDLEHPY